MPRKRSNAEKALRLESKGDEYLAGGKYEKALKEYKKALSRDPTRASLLTKLIKAKDLLPGDWGKEEFAESMSWVMKKQEIEAPSIKQVHARLTPEWEEATGLAMEILHAPDEKTMGILIERLVGMGEVATRAAIGLLVDLKKAAAKEET